MSVRMRACPRARLHSLDELLALPVGGVGGVGGDVGDGGVVCGERALESVLGDAAKAPAYAAAGHLRERSAPTHA
eukprot:4263486-Pleurochrysis_carterae.AAC.1